jgi:N-acetylglutamate synthase-like GNAT family acetyltransferase
MSILIRNATLSDIPKLKQLLNDSVRGLSIGYYSKEEIERSLVKVFGVDTQLIEDGTYYVAEKDGEIVGCGGWSKRSTLFGGDQVKDGAETEIRPEDAPARIRAFFISPAHARQGIGKRILETCESAACRHGFTRAELAATLPGEPLYAAFGYQPIEPVNIDVDLGDGHALRCIRMGKPLVAAGESTTE